MGTLSKATIIPVPMNLGQPNLGLDSGPKFEYLHLLLVVSRLTSCCLYIVEQSLKVVSRMS